MADIYDAIADPTRRELLGRLLEGSRGDGGDRGMSVSELVAELGVSQPTVSKHLRTLRERGLVTVREEGQHRFYRLETAGFAPLEDWLAPFLAASDARFQVPLAIGGEDAASTAFAAWAGPGTGGDRLGRAAAETAHTARVAIEAAQERLQGARRGVRRVRDRVADRLPRSSRNP